MAVLAGVFVSALLGVSAASAIPALPKKAEILTRALEPLVIKVQQRQQNIKRRLRRNGYRNFVIKKRRKAPGFTVKACKKNRRFLLQVNRRGKITSKIDKGRCGNKANAGGLRPPQVRRKLQDRGFKEIRFLDRQLPVYVVTACKRGKKVRLRVNGRASVTSSRPIGRCGARQGPREPKHMSQPSYLDYLHPRGSKRPAQIRTILQDRGFSKIRFMDRRLPTYVVRACKNNRRMELRLNGSGRITERDRIGRCKGANQGKRPPQIRTILRDRGFNQITFIDRRLPTYVVRACKNNRRMELRLNGAGRITERDRIGRCRVAKQGLKPPQVRRVLRTRGFSRILFTDHHLPVYGVEACRRDRKFEMRLNRFARITSKVDIGRCRTEHMKRGYGPREVHDILHRRGYSEIDFFDRSLPGYGATACKRGQKFRMRINRFAEIKHRRRTGFCRPPKRAPEPVNDNYAEVDEEEINGTEKIDPETCQTYLDALVRRNRIHFDVASASLRRGSYGLLERLGRVMERCPSSRIEISGHTDSDGSRDYNRHLSRRRAKTVAGFLAQEGVSLGRMTAYGYGEDQPLMRYERTDRDKARNRRIEFTVIWGNDEDLR